MKLRRWLLLALWAWLPAVQAHLMPDGQGGVRISGDTVTSLVSVPVAVLHGVDDSGDGRLSPVEFTRHRAQINSQLAARFRLFSGEQAERIVFQDVLFPDLKAEGQAGALHLVLMRSSRWPQAVDALRVRADLFAASGTDSQLRLHAARGTENELAVMTAQRMEHRFFRGTLAVVADGVRLGAEHILQGFDHLLFLLTILVAGAGWAYWLAVVTSFTVAHSITLALAAFGLVAVPAVVVEPLIAASIVLLAVDNLVRGQGAHRRRLPLVFGCGLLHGLGIASALTGLGLSGRERAWSLLGFNLGVELGQMLFLAALLAVLYLLRRIAHASWHARMVRACSIVAAVLGTGWMLERIPGML